MDPEVPGSSPEWVSIFYEARSTAQGLPEPSSLWGSTLGTSPVEYQDSDWCELNKQLQLRTVFAGTVVNNYQFNGIQGWAGQLCQIKCRAVI